MDNKTVLTKAIQKAIDGGWEPSHFNTLKGSYKHPDESEFHDLLGAWHNISPFDVIFNHGFAKSLWGDRFINPELRDDTGSKVIAIKRTAWKFHLQQMVIADDPIKYLGENL